MQRAWTAIKKGLSSVRKRVVSAFTQKKKNTPKSAVSVANPLATTRSSNLNAKALLARREKAMMPPPQYTLNRKRPEKYRPSPLSPLRKPPRSKTARLSHKQMAKLISANPHMSPADLAELMMRGR